jgi:hypothetical protein
VVETTGGTYEFRVTSYSLGTTLKGCTGALSLDSDYNFLAYHRGVVTIAGGGAHNKYVDNFDFVTKNAGTATGTGSEQEISHGLSLTPTKVTLTPKSATALPYQSNAPTSTKIKVLAGNGQDFYWEAEV